jgi:hypothetical protein
MFQLKNTHGMLGQAEMSQSRHLGASLWKLVKITVLNTELGDVVHAVCSLHTMRKM